MTLLHDWEFNVLGVYNYNKPGKLDPYYDWIRRNHASIDGDILEAGVFRGRSLLATALLLKELGSSKRVFGFDSFGGFPPIYDAKDRIEEFEDMLRAGRISPSHYAAHKQLVRYRTFLKQVPVDVANISSSEDFSGTSLAAIRRKAEFLDLDNIVFVAGAFSETMTSGARSKDDARFSCGLLDCDLYESYRVTLAYLWPRLSPGGFLYLDEYFSLKFPGARSACDEFFDAKAEKPSPIASEDPFFERWGVHKSRGGTSPQSFA